MVGLDSLQRLPGGAERGHCLASYPCAQGSVEASVGGPQSKPVEGVVDCGGAADGKYQNDG